MLRHTLKAAILTVTVAAASLAFAAERDQQPVEKSAVQNSMPGQSAGEANHANFVQAQHATDWRGSRLIGATVYGPPGIGRTQPTPRSGNPKLCGAALRHRFCASRNHC